MLPYGGRNFIGQRSRHGIYDTESRDPRACPAKCLSTPTFDTTRCGAQAEIPEVEILDMRKHLNDKSASFSEVLLDKISEKIIKEQVVLVSTVVAIPLLLCVGIVVSSPNVPTVIFH